MLKLHIQDDEGKTTVVPLVSDQITIGRDGGNNVQLKERNVSRHHARLFRKGSGLCVEDVKSSYGTRVNGVRIHGETSLKPSDMIQIGDYKIRYREELGDSHSPARSGETAIVDISKMDGSRAPVPPNHHALLRASGPTVDAEFTIVESPIVIGRTPDNDWSLDEKSISQHHVEVRFEDERFILTDLGSANGMTVNGEKYTRVALTPGDEIRIGNLTIQFMMGVSATSSWEAALMEESEPSADSGAATIVGDLDIPHTPRKKGMLAITAVLGIAGIALALAYFLHFSKPAGDDETLMASNAEPQGSHATTADDRAETRPGHLQPQPPPAAEADGTTKPHGTAPAPKPTGPELLAEAKTAWARGQRDKAYDLVDRAAGTTGAGDEARALRGAWELETALEGRLKKLAAMNTDRKFVEALAFAEGIEVPKGSRLRGRYEDLVTQARQGRMTDLFSKGADLVAAKKLDRAQKVLAQLRKVNPSGEEVRALEGRIASARATARRTAARHSKPAGSASRPSRGKPERNVRKTADAAAAGSHDPGELYKQARKISRSNRNEAIKLLLKVVKLKSNHAGAHKLLGMLYLQSGKRSSGLKHLRKYLNLRPNDAAIRDYVERLSQ